MGAYAEPDVYPYSGPALLDTDGLMWLPTTVDAAASLSKEAMAARIKPS